MRLRNVLPPALPTVLVCALGGHGIDVQLYDHTEHNGRVVWTPRTDGLGCGNSFVLTESPDGDFQTADGRLVRLWCVNGMGEIRWPNEARRVNGALARHAAGVAGALDGDSGEAAWAAARFGLTARPDDGWPVEAPPAPAPAPVAMSCLPVMAALAGAGRKRKADDPNAPSKRPRGAAAAVAALPPDGAVRWQGEAWHKLCAQARKGGRGTASKRALPGSEALGAWPKGAECPVCHAKSGRIGVCVVPASAIERKVGGIHVGTSDEDVSLVIESYASAAGWPAYLVEEGVRIALAAHHDNRRVYNQVMGGVAR